MKKEKQVKGTRNTMTAEKMARDTKKRLEKQSEMNLPPDWQLLPEERRKKRMREMRERGV